jgi:hypothetical protein
MLRGQVPVGVLLNMLPEEEDDEEDDDAPVLPLAPPLLVEPPPVVVVLLAVPTRLEAGWHAAAAIQSAVAARQRSRASGVIAASATLRVPPFQPCFPASYFDWLAADSH